MYKKTPHMTKNNIYFILLFSINHYVPLTALSDDDNKEAFPNLPSYPTILSMILDFKGKIQKNIQKEIEQAKKLTKGFLELFYVIGLIETPDYTLGGDEMSQLIENEMGKLQVERHKWLSLTSDGAGDMEKLAHNLEVEWDRCIIHLLHLLIQKF